jgi:hypothetical protein
MGVDLWPLHPLVQHDVAMLCPVCDGTIEDGRCVRPDLRREGVRWYSCRYPRRCRSMDVVMVEWPGSCRVRARFPRSCSLCTVMSISSAGTGAMVGGPHGFPPCQRAPRVPRCNISDVKKQLKLDYEASSSINIKWHSINAFMLHMLL